MKTFKQFQEEWTNKYKKSIDCSNPKGFSQRAHCAGKKKSMSEMNNPRISKKPGQPDKSDKHSDLYTDEDPKGTIQGLGFKDVATAKESVSKIKNSGRSHAHKIQAAIAMEQRAKVMGKSSESAIFRSFINSMKEKTKKINEESESKKCKPGYYYCNTNKECKPLPSGFNTPGQTIKPTEVGIGVPVEGSCNHTKKGKMCPKHGMKDCTLIGETLNSVTEEGLRDWFGKSKSKEGKSGWVNVVTGGTCASDEPGEGTPKCVSSAKRASMTKAERLSAARRKKAADPGQQAKTGAAKPTYVSTDVKEGWSDKYKKSINCDNPKGFSQRAHCQGRKKKMDEQSFQINTSAHNSAQKQQKIRNLATGTNNPNEKSAAMRKLSGPSLPLVDEYINEVKDKKGKGSGTKDACYHKVKSRYDVWPSAYASGALVKCRKVGAANWGTKSEETVVDEAQKCWPGYKKKGTKKMFGKTYNNCVKESEEVRYCPLCKKNESKTDCSFGPALWEKYSIAKVHPANEEMSMNEALRSREERMARMATPKTKKEQEKKRVLRSKAEEILSDIQALKKGKTKSSTKSQKFTTPEAEIRKLKPGQRKDTLALKASKAMHEESNLMRYNEYGQTYVIRFTWRGLMYKVQIFIPSLKRPSAQEIKTQLNKIYPGAQLLLFQPKENDPVDPTIVFAKEDRDLDEGKADKKLPEHERSAARLKRYSNPSGALALGGGQQRARRAEHEARRGKSKRWWDDDGDGIGYEKGEVSGKFKEDLDINEVAAWQRREGKNRSGGLNEKGRKSYERDNPGSDLKAPSKKVGNPRRASFCARMSGMKRKLTSAKTANDPNSRINKSLRAWNC